MKAWRMHGVDDVRLDEVPMPVLRPGWVLIKVRVFQVSVTEAMRIKGGAHYKTGVAQKMFSQGIPVQMGHEFCGEVVEVTEGVETVRVGDKVSASGYVACGECSECKAGRRGKCLATQMTGVEVPGAFAEYFALPDYVLAKLPDDISWNEGATIQPLSAAFDAVKGAELQMNDTIVVIGLGNMGLGCMQIARVSGAGLTIGIDIRQESLDLAKKLGADTVVDATKTDPVKKVKELTGGVGPDVVFEVAGGSPEEGLSGVTTLNQALNMVMYQGKVIEIANLPGLIELDSTIPKGKRIKIIFPLGGSRESQSAAARLVVSKRVQIAPMISHVLQGIEKFPEALDITANKAKYKATNPAQVIVS
ncbi:zinc-binding dehydrogenase [Chloroflexota bacterium]